MGLGLTGRDTLDAATAGKTADGGFGNALNVIAEDFTMALRTAFS